MRGADYAPKVAISPTVLGFNRPGTQSETAGRPWAALPSRLNQGANECPPARRKPIHVLPPNATPSYPNRPVIRRQKGTLIGPLDGPGDAGGERGSVRSRTGGCRCCGGFSGGLDRGERPLCFAGGSSSASTCAFFWDGS